MIDHEQRMREARVHAAAAREAADLAKAPPERRTKYDVWAHLERLQASCDAERKALESERASHREWRAAVVTFGRQVRVVYWLGALLATAMFATGFWLIQRNREAIEVSCLVVVQVVRDSGANSGKPRATPEGRAQARITSAFYAELLKGMTPKRRAAVLKDQAIVRKAGGSIPEPQCQEIADDPGKVRRETLQTRR